MEFEVSAKELLQIFLNDIRTSLAQGWRDTASFFEELRDHCLPHPSQVDAKAFQQYVRFLISFVHVPYFPAIHRPGWLLRYILGPFDQHWFDMFFSDVWAGITVALTLIPQALSYATLANLPPICGLYSSVLPSAVYTFFGSSLQLAVGPVAIVSLMTGSIISKYVPDYAKNTDDAIALAGEIALCCGVILTVLSLLNLGNFIRYISHPVMSGFTSGAACIIGLNQLKGAFGFANKTVPQAGQEGYDYNYQVMQWFLQNWNNKFTAEEVSTGKLSKLYIGHLYRNEYATKICFATFSILMLIQFLKNGFRPNKERNKSIIFRVWQRIAALSPFIAIIICGHAAYEIKKNDHFKSKAYTHDYDAYSLKIVNKVAPGLDFLHVPEFKHPFGEILVETIPLTLIAFMESYSVARKIAVSKNELHILNASQELFANGVANLLACVSSAYPVSGSFSRSSLNAAVGARTPLSSVVTMIVVIVTLKSLTKALEFIPTAALSAIIFCAVFNLIGFTDFWHAFKYSKKDFFTMLSTFIIVLAFDTAYGLACGIGCSVLMLLYEMAFAKETKPELVTSAKDNDGIDVVKVHGDMNFITSGKVKDMVSDLTSIEPEHPEENNLSEVIFHRVTTAMDTALSCEAPVYMDKLPKKIVIDLSTVQIIDLSGLEALEECIKEAKVLKVPVELRDPSDHIKHRLIKFGIFSDPASSNSNSDNTNVNTNVNNEDSIELVARDYKPVETDEHKATLEIENSSV